MLLRYDRNGVFDSCLRKKTALVCKICVIWRLAIYSHAVSHVQVVIEQSSILYLIFLEKQCFITFTKSLNSF